jgi:hypothetical protein
LGYFFWWSSIQKLQTYSNNSKIFLNNLKFLKHLIFYFRTLNVEFGNEWELWISVKNWFVFNTATQIQAVQIPYSNTVRGRTQVLLDGQCFWIEVTLIYKEHLKEVV